MAKSKGQFLPKEEESEQDYIQRVRATLLPNFPPTVLSQWLYRHKEHALYGVLGYDTLVFEDEPQAWTTDEVPLENCGAYQAIQNYAWWYDESVGKWGCEWLCKYMGQHGTWPEPIIFIDNRDGVVREPEADRHRPTGMPYHLLEGHRRLGFFLALKRRNALVASHKVWVVKKQ